MIKLTVWLLAVTLLIWFIEDSFGSDAIHLKVAQELPKELAMKTDVGEVVLTTEPCVFKDMGLEGYEYAAYATEVGHANHEGCWKKEGIRGMSAVYVYFPEVNYTVTYNPIQFKPR